MKASEVKVGDHIVIGSVPHVVSEITSCPEPYRLTLELTSISSPPMKITVHKDAQLKTDIDVPFNELRIRSMFEEALTRQLAKGQEHYGKNYFSGSAGDELLYMLEELVDAFAYLYVAIERRKNRA